MIASRVQSWTISKLLGHARRRLARVSLIVSKLHSQQHHNFKKTCSFTSRSWHSCCDLGLRGLHRQNLSLAAQTKECPLCSTHSRVVCLLHIFSSKSVPSGPHKTTWRLGTRFGLPTLWSAPFRRFLETNVAIWCTAWVFPASILAFRVPLIPLSSPVFSCFHMPWSLGLL